MFSWISYKWNFPSQVPVAYACNPSYSGGRDQEDRGSKPAWTNSSWDLKKTITKKGWWSGSRCRPRVQISALQKKKCFQYITFLLNFLFSTKNIFMFLLLYKIGHKNEKGGKTKIFYQIQSWVIVNSSLPHISPSFSFLSFFLPTLLSQSVSSSLNIVWIIKCIENCTACA
jgi:hypothetical protein